MTKSAAEPIHTHEGRKYLRRLYPVHISNAHTDGDKPILVDVYEVINGFGVTDPAVAHCIKKLLCTGQRGKGDYLADLVGAKAALNRAIEEAQRPERLPVDMCGRGMPKLGRIVVVDQAEGEDRTKYTTVRSEFDGEATNDQQVS